MSLRSLGFVLFACATLVFASSLGQLPGWTLALASVGAGILLCGLAAERFSTLELSVGAGAALLWQAAQSLGAFWAFGALLVVALLPRAWRARGLLGRLSVLSLGALSGLASHAIWERFLHHEAAVQGSALLVIAVLLGLPLLIPVDDPLTSGLLTQARTQREPTKTVLLRAVLLRRKALDAGESSKPPELRRTELAWQGLLDLAEGRAEADDKLAALLDPRLERHVSALERLYAAVSERNLRQTKLRIGALEATEAAHTAIEEELAILHELSLQKLDSQGSTPELSAPKESALS